MRKNLNVTVVEQASQYVPGGVTTVFECNGCGMRFTAHGLRAHQSARFNTAACKPMWDNEAECDPKQ